MRAAIQTGIHQVEVRDIAAPSVSDDAAILTVTAAGICGSDLHPYHERAAAQDMPEGHEASGVITFLPNGYQGVFTIGDRVAVDPILGRACGICAICRAGQAFHCPERPKTPRWGGAFAEQYKMRPQGLFGLPANVTMEQGALVEPFGIGVHAVRLARMVPGASVAIIGAGTIGLMTLIAARGLGAGDIFVLARHDHQARLAAKLGATVVIRSEGEAAIEEVRRLTNGIGVDLAMETVGGHGDTINQALDIARRQGSVSVLGIFPSKMSIDILKASVREITATFPICCGIIDGRHDFEIAIKMIASGQAQVEKLVTHRYPLDAATAAFKTAADKSTGSVKVQLTT